MYQEFLESAYYKSLDDEGTEGDDEGGTRKEQGSAIDQETECVTAQSLPLLSVLTNTHVTSITGRR
jgi:hypothetical protein